MRLIDADELERKLIEKGFYPAIVRAEIKHMSTIDNNEQCINCKHCKELYTPPTITEEAKHEYCCILFLVMNEDTVMYLGTDVFGMCECFDEKECEE